jgi:hypothetical protein
MKDAIEHMLERGGIDPEQVNSQTLISSQDLELYVSALNFTLREILPETIEQVSPQSQETLNDVFMMVVFVCFQASIVVGQHRFPEASGTLVTDGDIELLGLFLASHPDVDLPSIFPSREEVWKVWHNHPPIPDALSTVSGIFREEIAGPNSQVIEARNLE